MINITYITGFVEIWIFIFLRIFKCFVPNDQKCSTFHTFFAHFSVNWFQTWYMHSSWAPTDQVRISSKSGQNWVIYGQNKVKLRFCIFCSRPLICHNMKFFIYYFIGFDESITVYFRQIFNSHSYYVEQIHLPRGVSSDRWAFRLALLYSGFCINLNFG